jgi:chromosome segregation ATPase
LHKYEEEEHDLEEIEKTIIILKAQLEEEKRIEKAVRSQLKETKEKCEKLKDEIDSLIKELEKTTIHLNKSLKFENSIEILDKIISQ